MEVKQLFDLLRKEVECSFCVHPVNKPKTLRCLHSFCLECLNNYAASRREQGHTTFKCPECLATFQLPDNDKFDAFQTAFHKNRLLDILALEKSGTGGTGGPCFECQTFFEFTVITKDDEGRQQRYYKREQVTVHIQTAAQEELEVKIEDKKDGAYHVTYVPQSRGQHHVMINVNGQPLTGSPWNVHVTPHQYQAISSFGSRGTGKGKFQDPCGISVSSTGNIAVADRGNTRVQVFTSEGKYLREFGQGLNPVSVAYTSPEHIIVVDEGKKALLFTESGTLVRQFGPVHLKSPGDVSVTNDGRVIVCDWDDKAVKVLSPDGEELLLSFVTPGNASPSYAVCHKEKFFVSYEEKDCIKVFDVSGKYLHDIGGEGTGDGQLEEPRGVDIDKFGDLLVADGNHNRLQVFTAEGDFLSTTGNRGKCLFNYPDSIAVSRDGHIYVTASGSDRVQIFL